MDKNLERVPHVKTVVDEVYTSETLEFVTDLSDNKAKFELHGMTVDRSYEDREVYFNIDTNTGWLRGEDAIKLGQKLIEHGTRALNANRINHQAIHRNNNLMKFIDEDRVEKLVIKLIKDSVPNYGEGHKLFRLIPIWKEGKAPEYQEDFCTDVVKYFSPFEDTYNEQIAFYKVPVEFIGYDHEEAVRKFNEQVESMEEPTKEG